MLTTFASLDLIVVAAYGLMIAMPHLKAARSLILANIFTNLMTALYFGISGAETGMALCVIAGVSSLSQYLVPISDNPKIRRARVFLGLTGATIATAIFYEGVADITICAAIYSLRIAEALASVLLLRLAILSSAFAWMFYAYEQGLYWVCLAELLTLLSAIAAIWLSRRQKRQVKLA